MIFINFGLIVFGLIDVVMGWLCGGGGGWLVVMVDGCWQLASSSSWRH